MNPGAAQAEHYLMTREHHFEDVVNGGGARAVDVAEALATTPVESAAEWSATCDAAGSRIRRRGAAEKDRTRGDRRGERVFCENRIEPEKAMEDFSGVTNGR
ncbi:MAG: hypothetical protein ACKO3G_04790 [Planctomycetaceae bacterium]